MIPTVGAIVNYTLTQDDADGATRRRTETSPLPVIDATTYFLWPAGAQAHVGNDAHAGDVVPMVVVRVFPADPQANAHAPGAQTVNGQAFLDGNDVLWVTGVYESVGPKPGCWNAIPADPGRPGN